jgi:glucan endo-1,3-alpha-glucosidase
MQRAIISIFTLFAVAKAAPVPVFQHHHGLRAPQESSSFTPIITLTLIPSTVTLTTEAESEISTVTILTTMTLVPTSTPETSESVSVTPSSIASTTSASTSETIASSSVPASQSQSSESATSASATTSSAITTATSIPSSSGNKLVVAHMMVGNTYPFTKDTWKSDIKLAQSAGIDGFALNIGRDEWQPGHVADA